MKDSGWILKLVDADELVRTYDWVEAATKDRHGRAFGEDLLLWLPLKHHWLRAY